MMIADRRAHWVRPLIFYVVFFAPRAVLAHTEHPNDLSAPPAISWTMPADIVFGIAIFALLYAVGLWRHRARNSAASQWRHVSFFSGLAALFVALASPLDALADHLFFMHQVQHLLLQTVGPMLLLLAAPAPLLVAGMPSSVQRHVIAPIMASRGVRGLFSFLVRPWIATMLLVASLYGWQWPPYHDLSVLHNGVHYFMHITMLAAGLLFYAAVFDPRPAPLGPSYGTRISVLLYAMTANMLLGAGLALKDSILYSAYDQFGRLWGYGALADERLGGLIVWIPGSAVCVLAFIAVLRLWGARETRLDTWRERGIASATPAARAGNHRVAYWLAFAVVITFATTVGVGVIALR